LDHLWRGGTRECGYWVTLDATLSDERDRAQVQVEGKTCGAGAVSIRGIVRVHGFQ